MKYFITGINGLLGSEVAEQVKIRGHDVLGCGTKDICIVNNVNYIKLDITNKNQLISTIIDYKPDVVIHCAAWTDVDKAELKENIFKVLNLNFDSTYNIVKTCKELDCKLIYISTDYVFYDNTTLPHKDECESAIASNYYGRTKVLGELVIKNNLTKYFIARVQWLYGKNGRNFIDQMIKLGKDMPYLNVINDQFGIPTSVEDLSKALVDLSESNQYGSYNITNSGEYTSWYDYCKYIFSISQINTTVNPISTEDYSVNKIVANRPLNSRLDCSKFNDVFYTLPNWKNSVYKYIINNHINN